MAWTTRRWSTSTTCSPSTNEALVAEFGYLLDESKAPALFRAVINAFDLDD